MTNLLHKPSKLKVFTKGEMVENTLKAVHVVYGWPRASFSRSGLDNYILLSHMLQLYSNPDRVLPAKKVVEMQIGLSF